MDLVAVRFVNYLTFRQYRARTKEGDLFSRCWCMLPGWANTWSNKSWLSTAEAFQNNYVQRGSQYIYTYVLDAFRQGLICFINPKAKYVIHGWIFQCCALQHSTLFLQCQPIQPVPRTSLQMDCIKRFWWLLLSLDLCQPVPPMSPTLLQRLWSHKTWH